MSIERNVEGRRVALALVELAGDELTREAWETLRDLAIERVGARVEAAVVAAVVAMSDDEARRFERVPLPWGMYRGVAVGEVSTAYLLAITELPFGSDLRRYMASGLFRVRQDEWEG